MFTGIVEELGEVTAVEKLDDASRFRLRGPLVTQDAKHGDSIAVNGVCLTVVESGDGEFTADVMAETLKRSSLGVASGGLRMRARALPVASEVDEQTVGSRVVRGPRCCTRLHGFTRGRRAPS